jgi:hypothetical protein
VEPETVPAEPAAQPSEATAQPRDKSGRFAPKAPQPEAETAVAEAPKAPETPSEPTTATEPAVEEPGPAFSYQADGRAWEMPGTEVGEDGVFFSNDALHELTRLLAAGRNHEGTFRQRLSESAQREQAAAKRAEAAEERSKQVLEHFDQLFAQSQGATTFEELLQKPLGKWLLDAYTQYPILRAKADAAGVQKQAEADRAQLEQLRAQQQEAQLQPLMDQALVDSLTSWGQQAGASQQQLQAAYDWLTDPAMRSVLFVKVPADMPERGLRAGDWAIDHAVVQRALQRVAAMAPKAATKPASSAAKPAQPIPPTVSGQRGPTPSGTKPKLPQPKTKKNKDGMTEDEFWEAFDKNPSFGLVE